MREILERAEREISSRELVIFFNAFEAMDYLHLVANADYVLQAHSALVKEFFGQTLLPQMAFTKTFDSQLRELPQGIVYILAIFVSMLLFDNCDRQMRLRPVEGEYRQFDVFDYRTIVFKDTVDEDGCVLYIFAHVKCVE
jgi:hypothetical protein